MHPSVEKARRRADDREQTFLHRNYAPATCRLVARRTNVEAGATAQSGYSDRSDLDLLRGPTPLSRACRNVPGVGGRNRMYYCVRDPMRGLSTF
jgi:hypothetical protein